MKSGRPDTGFLYWRWNPRHCDLPQLNPERFLDKMRNRTWALIGDSISRNHVQSLLCVLSKAETAIFEDNEGVSTHEAELQIDKLDTKWTEQYQGLDYIVFSINHWFLKFGFVFAYRKVLRDVFNFIVTSNHKGMIFYRTSTPHHFENGGWLDGGNCPYQRFHPFAEDKNAKIVNDCLHWCLLGPIDSWNDLLMEMVVNGKDD
ncbi:unnamed protein product [Ilex paraguariensis]|uniref:Trichome birefringence-like C-terminal domain-containing protein n=1 Tax=Ilex paraguariensis TaxID=185542 RepID=A0ABC8T6G2_9AQUA